MKRSFSFGVPFHFVAGCSLMVVAGLMLGSFRLVFWVKNKNSQTTGGWFFLPIGSLGSLAFLTNSLGIA